MVMWCSLTTTPAPASSADRWSARRARWGHSGGGRQEPSQPHDVVRRRGEGEDPGDQRPATMAEFAQPTDRFHPAETLLHQLAFLLTDRIARVTCRATIDRAAAVRTWGILRDMR